VGDRDLTSNVEETIEIYRKLKQAQLMVLPNTAHPFEKIDDEVLAHHVLKFFN
jgi:hypothetical protein